MDRSNRGGRDDREQRQLAEHEHELLHKVLEGIMTLMATADEVKAKLTDALGRLKANTDSLKGISTFIKDVRVELADVKQQLADLIAAGTNSPQDLQDISDSVDEIIAATDEQTVKEAAVVNTPDDDQD